MFLNSHTFMFLFSVWLFNIFVDTVGLSNFYGLVKFPWQPIEKFQSIVSIYC